MALRLVLARQAATDIDEIIAFIEAENESASKKLVAGFEHLFGLLTGRPFMGSHAARINGADIRKMSMPPYIIYYRVSKAELQIVRVLHSSRDLDLRRLLQS